MSTSTSTSTFKSATQLSLLADSVESLIAQGRINELDQDTLDQIERKIDDWERSECKSLYQFVKAAWDTVESRPFAGNWHMACICEHLEAVTRGEIPKLLINLPPGHSKPVHVDEPIITRDGYKLLSDIKVGDKVLTHRGRFREVLNVYEQGELPLLTVKTSSGRVVRTARDHPYLTKRGWIEAQHLSLSDHVFRHKEGDFEWEAVEEVGTDGDGHCRCLMVDKDHSFFANDIAVHNSLLVSTFWPMWEWGPFGNPSQRWFYTSYDQKLSIRDSMRCRMIMRSPWYQRLWGDSVQIMQDEDQKTFYRTTAGGWRMASSIGGHLLGEHPGRLNIDDPHSVEQVESDAERKAVLDWWDLTIPSRRIGGKATLVIVMQRLNELDLAGYVLGEGDWVHLCFPLRFESDHPFISYSRRFDPRTKDGELLSPGYYTEEQAKETERQLGRRLGEYGRSGQLQQRPSPRSGGMFKYEYFKFIPRESLPQSFDSIVRFWDKAGTPEGGKFTSGVLEAKKGDIIYVLDVKRAQLSPKNVELLIENTAIEDERRFGLQVETWVEQEGGSGGKFQAEYTVERLKGMRVRAEPAMKSKQLRAEPWSAYMESGLVLCAEADWNEEFRAEHLGFPAGKFSDQVDSAGGAFRKLIRPDIVRVDSLDLDACMTLTGPAYDHKHPYQYAIGSLFCDQFQKNAALVILGVNSQSGMIGLLHANRWLPEHYVNGRIPVSEIVNFAVQKCVALRVDGVAIDPGNAEVVGVQMAKRGVRVYDFPLDAKNRRKAASMLLDLTTSRKLELYNDRDLFAEVTRLPIKTSVDGYSLEDTKDMGTSLGYGVAFAVAAVWAVGTLNDHRSNVR